MQSTTNEAETPRCGQTGFSIVEALIASALILGIAIGIIPLFVMAMQSNLEGQDSTQVANHARTRMEEFYQLPWESEFLQIQAGTERVFEEFYSKEEKRWIDMAGGDTPADDDPYLRTTTIRQYHINEFLDAQVTATPPDPLPATASPNQVHLKEIEVEVRGTRGPGPLGASKDISLRAVKAD